MTLKQIISGGQTGADRAALEWAIFHDIPHGGWCPKGRKAEDGPVAGHYALKETPDPSDEDIQRDAVFQAAAERARAAETAPTGFADNHTS